MILVSVSACNNKESGIITNEADNEVIMETFVNDHGVSVARLNYILDSARKMTDRTTDEVEVAFFGLDKQPFKDINGVDTLISPVR